MPLFDKMKEQASQVAARAQEAGKAGQAKLEEAQAKRQSDALLRRLGAAVYAQRTGRGENAEDVDELIAAITAHEDAHGPVADEESSAASAGQPEPAAPEGDFKLE